MDSWWEAARDSSLRCAPFRMTFGCTLFRMTGAVGMEACGPRNDTGPAGIPCVRFAQRPLTLCEGDGFGGVAEMAGLVVWVQGRPQGFAPTRQLLIRP